MFSQRTVIVLGSAPNPQLPNAWPPNAALVCVNSSGWSAAKLQLPTPDLTILAGFKLAVREREVDRQALRSLATKRLLLIEQWPHYNPLTIEQAKQILTKYNYHYDQFTSISNHQRAHIMRQYLGRPSIDLIRLKSWIAGRSHRDRRRPTNGLFAVCYALHQGANNVILSGFSLNEDDHAYQTGRMRQQIDPDRTAIDSLIQRGLPVATFEPELARITGLPIIPSLISSSVHAHHTTRQRAGDPDTP